MDKPFIHLYLRHYVRDAVTLERYRDIVFRVLKIPNSLPLVIKMVIGFSTELSPDHRYQMFLLSRNLLDRNIAVHHLPGKGAGHAFFHILGQSLADATIKNSVLCLLDADQFPFDNPRFLAQLDKLSSSMVKEDRLVGLGLRDRIFLGDGKLGQCREIEEMFHALFVRRKVKYKDRKDLSIPQAYKDLGDPVPGCYCFNLHHKKFPQFIEQCLRDARLANLWQYAGDPYIIMLASTIGSMVTEVMSTHDNPPNLFTLQDIELKSFELGKTCLRKEYYACVKNKGHVALIQKYYPTEAVHAVQQMILQGMEKSSRPKRH